VDVDSGASSGLKNGVAIGELGGVVWMKTTRGGTCGCPVQRKALGVPFAMLCLIHFYRALLARHMVALRVRPSVRHKPVLYQND